MSVIRWSLAGIAAAWAAYLTYLAIATAAPSTVELVRSPPLRSTIAAVLVAVTVAVLIERAVKRVNAAAGARYRDGYADGYVDGVADRRPAPERTLRAVR